MDILKRNASPVTSKTWDEIDETAKDVILNLLTARRVVSVDGPKGWDYTAVDIGRLKTQEDGKGKVGDVNASTFELKPLVEARVSFELSKWEIDNIERGAKDIDLDALEEASEALALFEEEAIFNGYDEGKIQGLTEVAGNKVSLGKSGDSIVKAIGEAKYVLNDAYASEPYDLVVSPKVYEAINIVHQGAYLPEVIKDMIGGNILRSKVIDGAVLVPHKDDDLEMTIGQDFSVGFEYETPESVMLFVTESFTFRVLDEDKIVHLTLG